MRRCCCGLTTAEQLAFNNSLSGKSSEGTLTRSANLNFDRGFSIRSVSSTIILADERRPKDFMKFFAEDRFVIDDTMQYNQDVTTAKSHNDNDDDQQIEIRYEEDLDVADSRTKHKIANTSSNSNSNSNFTKSDDQVVEIRYNDDGTLEEDGSSQLELDGSKPTPSTATNSNDDDPIWSALAGIDNRFRE